MANDAEVKLFMLTWNLKSKGPKEDFRALVGLDEAELPDIYAFGYQEAPIRPSNLVEGPWVVRMRKLLAEKNYVKLRHITLQGITLVVHAKREHITAIRDIEVNYTRTGFGGLWGNKGGVTVRMNFRGRSICLINCHLAAHDHKLDQRISDYHSIVNNQKFTNKSSDNVFAHDYVMIMGDLNFRINDYTAKEIHDRIKDGSEVSRAQLLEKDQLTVVRSAKRAFAGFEETLPTFSPTYKFKANTDDYDMKKRKPAFTDRILYRCSTNSSELKVDQKFYKSHTEYRQSDHKPVTSMFTLKAQSKRLEPVYVQFMPVRPWRVGGDGLATYRFVDANGSTIQMSRVALDRVWDWIGLFRDDFTGLDQFISYVWSVDYFVPLERLTGEDRADGAASSYATALFGDVLSPGRFRLVYVNGENSTSVLGISDAFDVVF